MIKSAIYGAITGDIIGSAYEFRGITYDKAELFAPFSRYTDDTVLTIAVGDWIVNREEELKIYLKNYADAYYNAGYGPAFCEWLKTDELLPYNSCGNGSAMRVSSTGQMANSIEEAMELAKESAVPTHNHPEGIKGAQATAVAIYMAKSGNTKEEIRNKLMELFDYDWKRTYEDLTNAPLKFHVICQTTVPEALICFFESTDYIDCIKKAMVVNKDCDTSAAIAGSVAGMYYGIPDDIIEKTKKKIPQDFIDIADQIDELS